MGLATWSLELQAIHPRGPLGMLSYLPMLQGGRKAFPRSKVTRSPNQIPSSYRRSAKGSQEPSSPWVAHPQRAQAVQQCLDMRGKAFGQGPWCLQSWYHEAGVGDRKWA